MVSRTTFEFMLKMVVFYFFYKFRIELMAEAGHHLRSDLRLLRSYPFLMDRIFSAHAIGQIPTKVTPGIVDIDHVPDHMGCVIPPQAG
jgi:hypothetical protein